MKLFSLTIGMLLFFNLASAQNQTESSTEDSDKKQEKKDKKNEPPHKGTYYLTPVPVFGSNPAFGFIYGAGAAASIYLGDPGNTNLSSALAGIAFTTKKQMIITLKSTVFSNENNYIFMGDWRYLDSSQPTWGLGTGPQSSKLADNNFDFDDGSIEGNSEADMLEFKFIRVHETALKKINEKGLYAGVGLHVDIFRDVNDQLLDLSATVPVITPYYAYNADNGFDQKESTLIGVSANVIFDTRDNINNPYTGQYAMLSYKYNPEFIGSDKNSSSLWLEYRNYFNITPDHKNILALWAFGNFTVSGELPYMNLPAIGWDQYSKSGEPYSQGRFRGVNLLFSGIEYRKHLWATAKNERFLGMVAFLNATTADGYKNGIDLFDYVEPGYGLGLRINISKTARTNLGIDYGWGNYQTTGFFLRLNENF